MRGALWLMVAAVGTGCGGACPSGAFEAADGTCVKFGVRDTPDRPDEEPITDPEDCFASIDRLMPADDAAGVSVGATVGVVFGQTDPNAELVVFGDGGLLEGEQVWLDRTLLFVPERPLPADSELTAELSWCAGRNAWTWQTGAAPAPVDLDALVGETMAIDLESGLVVSSAPLQDIVLGLGAAIPVVEVQSVDGDEVQLRMGFAPVDDPSEQDTCITTSSPPVIEVHANPFFRYQADETTVRIVGADVRAFAVDLSGRIDGDQAVDIALRALIAADDLRPLIDPGGPPGMICDLIGSFGVECSDCAAGERACMIVHFTDYVARASDIELVEVTEACTEGQRCGCRSTGGAGAGWAVLAALALVRRRRTESAG